MSMTDQDAPNHGAAASAPPAELIAKLRAEMRGAVITPADRGYEEGRKIWNAMFDPACPAALLRCADEEDVAMAVRALAPTDTLIAVRGGGHHIAGYGTCDGGVVIDLGDLRDVQLAEEGSRALVGGGATLHEVDTATDPYRRSVPVGVVSETGIAGLTLSGGMGWLSRLYGYSCDNLLAARVVTADGEIVRVDEERDADLLWALRGGGGNFGVVTEFEFRTYPVDVVQVGEAYHLVKDAEEIEDLLRFYRDWTAELPRAATAWIGIEVVADDNGDLPGRGGQVVVGLLAAVVDASEEDGARILAPMLGQGSPTVSRQTPMRMLDLQHIQDDSRAAAKGLRDYMKGEMLVEITDAAIADIAARGMDLPSAASLFEMGTVGGAISDRGEMDAAVGLRNARYMGGYALMAETEEQVEPGIEWVRAAWRALLDGSAGGTYLNFSGDESSSRVLDSLGGDDAKRRRLRELKRRHDPRNVFRVNHNIDPAA
jgi:FAD/FMN-containing dehydrogenase